MPYRALQLTFSEKNARDNMEEKFASKFAVDPTTAYDASKLKGKSVVVTGGSFDLFFEVLFENKLLI